MLELKKENVQMLRVKNKAVSQVTFDVDYNVPDAKADMGRIVQSKADVSMDEVRLSEGKAFLKGSLNADILYVSENEGRICSLSASLPMDETVNLEGIQGGDKLCLSWEIFLCFPENQAKVHLRKCFEFIAHISNVQLRAVCLFAGRSEFFQFSGIFPGKRIQKRIGRRPSGYPIYRLAWHPASGNHRHIFCIIQKVIDCHRFVKIQLITPCFI